MNEEEMEELKDINQLRRRFPNSMPNFLKGGNWCRIPTMDSPWWAGVERKTIGIKVKFTVHASYHSGGQQANDI